MLAPARDYVGATISNSVNSDLNLIAMVEFPQYSDIILPSGLGARPGVEVGVEIGVGVKHSWGPKAGSGNPLQVMMVA